MSTGQPFKYQSDMHKSQPTTNHKQHYSQFDATNMTIGMMDIDKSTDNENNVKEMKKRCLDDKNLITNDEVDTVFAAMFQELPTIDDLSMIHDDESGPTLDTTSRLLLQLYEMQHNMYDTIQHQESILEEEISYQNNLQQQRMEHQYEQVHLLQQIQDYEGLFHTFPNLIQFAKEEVGATNTAAAGDATNTDDTMGDVRMKDDGVVDAAATTSAGDSGANREKEIVQQLLSSHGLNIDSIDDRPKIIDFIQTRMHERTELLVKIQNETKEIQLLRQEYNLQNDLLTNSIPIHIQTLERAATALSKVLYSTSSLPTNHTNTLATADTSDSTRGNIASSIQHMTGTDRISRIQMAQQLSSVPLYTIYQSMQHYFDVVQTQMANGIICDDGSSMIDFNNISRAIGKVTIDTHLNEVILHLPVLDVATAGTTTVAASNSKNKKVTMVSIHFAHFTFPIPHVAVYCTGCASILNQDILLDELFPNDVAMDDIILPTNSISTNRRGKSYLWCNHLAGLHPIPLASNANDSAIHMNSTTATKIQQQHVSTHIVVQELQRRIRANATLKYVLHSLCRSRVPTPPLQSFVAGTSSQQYDYSIIYTDPNWKAQCKLISFVATTATPISAAPSPNTTTYSVEIRRNGNLAITPSAVSPVFSCTVAISNTRYPAIVPIWDFSNGSSLSSSTLPAVITQSGDDVEQNYDTHIAQLAHRVNVHALDVIQNLSETQSSTSESQTDVSYGENVMVLQFCEWILVHQLREIMHFVDSILENSSDSMEYQSYKGRDRQIR